MKIRLFILTLFFELIIGSSMAQVIDEPPVFKHPSGAVFHSVLQANINRTIYQNSCHFSVGFVRFTIDSIGRMDGVHFSFSIPNEIRSFISEGLKATDGYWSVRIVNGKATHSKPFLLPLTILLEGACSRAMAGDQQLLKLLDFGQNRLTEHFDGIILNPLFIHSMAELVTRPKEKAPSKTNTYSPPKFSYKFDNLVSFLHLHSDLRTLKSKCKYSYGFMRFAINTSGAMDSVDISKSIPEEIRLRLVNAARMTSGLWKPAMENGKAIYSKSILLPIVIDLEAGCPDSPIYDGDPSNFAGALDFNGIPLSEPFKGMIMMQPLILNLRHEKSKEYNKK